MTTMTTMTTATRPTATQTTATTPAALRIPAGYRLARAADLLPVVCPLCGRERSDEQTDSSYVGWLLSTQWYDCGCPDVVEDEDGQPDPTTPARCPAPRVAWDDDCAADLYDLIDRGLAA